MFQIGGTNPWLSMWNQPRLTIRALIQHQPKYGVAVLATFFVLQDLFFWANWWSLGAYYPCSLIFFCALFLSPFLGFAWLCLVGLLLYFLGRPLNGHASFSQVRIVLAWSKLPASLALLMWLILIFMNPEFAFILDGEVPSSFFTHLTTFILNIWSLVLLVQSLREIQLISLGRSLFCVFLALLVTKSSLFLSVVAYNYLMF